MQKTTKKKNGLRRQWMIEEGTRNILKPAQNYKHSVSDVEEDVLVYVPPFQHNHTSWPEFERSLKKYMKATRQCLAQVPDSIRWYFLKNTTLVPQEAGPYQRKYIFRYGCPTPIVWCTRIAQALTFRVPVPDVELVDPERGWNLGITVKRELYVHINQAFARYQRRLSCFQELQAGASTEYQYIREDSNH
ncbi:LOW QUALITY PROTEIN: Hypothetical protein PHPALM_13914 [Phytophthora palmivora]|uniref:Uncharacterized protein n=1 Tax=Phytophthora palmivora TaxID=4796 RepID=A0A2P4XW36_9STRA|nr:LOW QUALITY PROTEIN: Hypothetical protein PHPALM_13914 [Phytophthora palmivora]